MENNNEPEEVTDLQKFASEQAELRRKEAEQQAAKHKIAEESKTIAGGTTSPTPEPAVRNYGEFWGDTKIVRVDPKPTATGTTAEPGEAGPTKISKQAVDTGARTAVATIDLAQTTLMRPIVNWRFRKVGEKRFGDKFEEALNAVVLGTTPASPEEKKVQLSVQALLDQRDKKILAIPFSSSEEKDLEYAFKEYFTQKNVAMSPEVLLYCSLGSIMGSRLIDAAMWD